MRRHVLPFLARHEAPEPLLGVLKRGAGAALGLVAVAWLARVTGWPLLLAPLGASVVLLFGQPGSPLAQPMHLFGGYFLGTCLAVGTAWALPGEPLAAALAVGGAVSLMAGLRVTHPPAGAVPLVALADPGGAWRLFPALLLASLALVAIAVLCHRLPPRTAYPKG